MEVNIKLNDYQYRYDIYHIFNIYNHLKKINFSMTEGDFEINVSEDKITYKHLDRYNEAYFTSEEKPKETIKKLLFSELKTLTGDIYPWGTLIGIRPSKIALKYIKEGKNNQEIRDIFKQKYYAESDKVDLCIDVAKSEEKFVNTDKNTISVYIGMAFCPSRCLYCSFASNSIEGNKKNVIPYIESLEYEISNLKDYINKHNLKIETVYFGGGTPTSVSEEQFEKIMDEVYCFFVENRDIKEFTVECGRADSITLNKLKTMKRYNVTRISINPQTMNDKTLKMIGRAHTSEDVIDKFNMARALGFDNINMDIIIGLPGEGIIEAENTFKQILKLSPDSLTVHGLALKRGSIMYENFINKKGLGLKSQSEILDMYNRSKQLASDLGMQPYYMYRQKNMVGNMENIGYSKPGKECIYNIEMIEDKQTIISIGADAVSKVVFNDQNRLERFWNVKGLTEYIDRTKELVEGKINLLDTLYGS